MKPYIHSWRVNAVIIYRQSTDNNNNNSSGAVNLERNAGHGHNVYVLHAEYSTRETQK